MSRGPKDPHLAEIIVRNDLGIEVRLPTDHIKVCPMVHPDGATDIRFDEPVAEALWRELCRVFAPEDPLVDEDDVEPGPEACWSERKLRREYGALRANEQDMRLALNEKIDFLRKHRDDLIAERNDLDRRLRSVEEDLEAERKLAERYARTLDVILDAADPDADPARKRRLEAVYRGPKLRPVPDGQPTRWKEETEEADEG